MNTSWIDGFISLADHQYETGLNRLEDVSLGAGQNSIVNTILEHKAVLNDGSFLDSLEDSQNYGRLLISAETLSRWKDLETQNLEESGVSYLNDLVCTAVSTNSVKHLPVITTQRSDLRMVLEKVPDILDAIAEDLLSRISVDNSAIESTVKILMQVKSINVLKDRFSGESGADLKINPSLLAKETFPVLANLLKSYYHFDMNHENQLNLWLLTRTIAREVNCFNVAKDLAYTLNSPIDYPDIEVIDSIESKRLELVQSKLGSNFLELVAVCREDGGKKYSANVRQIQAKALLACSKHVPEINWDVDFDTVIASLGGNMENISESCLNLATSISPDFGKAWLLRAQFSYSQGLALVDEVRLKRFVSLKRSFDEIHTLVNYPEIALSEFTSKIASVFVVELADQTTSKSSSGYQKGQLQKNLESAFSFISSKCSEAITLALQDLKATIVSHFKEAVMGYFKFLELDSLNANANTQTNVVLRLLRVLTTYDEEFEEEFRMQFTRSPVQPWLTVIPQLFACLGHSSPVVGNAIVPLLVRIAKEAPELIVYYYVVGTRSARVIRSPSLQKLYDQIKTGLNPTYTEHIGHLLDEFQKVTVLWEEIWFNKLTYLNSEAPKRLHQFGVEMSRLKSHPAMKSTIDIKEKYRILLFPVISAIERLLKETIEMSATTNHEMWFTTSYKDRILTALNRLREPVDLGSTKGLWEPFVQIMNDINKDFQQNRHLQLFNLSAKLQHLATLSVPLPVSGITADKLIIERFGEQVRILPTKTKPKRIEIITSNGTCRPFLLKGLEDLRLDERIQQTLKVANSLLQTDKQSRTRNLNARTYDIFPLGDHFGMIEWIDNVSQLFSIFKRWQMRDFAVRTSLSGKEGEVLQRPHEMFNTKLAVALKKHGVARNVSRRDWPSHVLTGVFKELCNETPNNLVKSELWAASPSADLWWEKTVTFSRSMGVNSILGYLIGLGDRHLDNIMVDCKKGEVVHIDYNVCFEKGLRLRVPENVPFRLTQNLVGAMGVGGIEGVFRISCNLTLGVLQNNKDVLLALLDSFVYDPIVDWAIDDEALEGKLEVLNLNVKFMWSRIAENKDDIVEAVQSLPQSAAYVYREMQNFVERSSRNHDIQKEIDLLTSEMKDLEIGGRVVKVETDETMLREELKSALNDSGVWYSKHQMAIAAILNPQLDEYLSSLNVNTSLVMDHLLTAASIETDEFDQRLLEVIEARERHLQLLYQRLKAYQVLVAPIVNGLLAQDLRQKVVQVLSGFGQSS
ncbi:Serine/threonine-protein kinase smg1, partial [Rhizoclosmatium hyalinum]